MADDTTRETAFLFALQAADLVDDRFSCAVLEDTVTDLLAAADRIAAWLEKPVVAKLVLAVGPVTEQT